uniref:cation diffusion facilitator family transporter n=1 Tax=Altererythrobacter segetis TaxID=1104773 RepID=UPI00140873B5|nr:cation diffusion facilitator family transporter [Altererythrobacter segetis]
MASGGKLVVLAALGGNLAIAVTKFAAALIAGSSSMLTEGIHSTVDTFNEVLLLYGRKRASQPPDELHPLGHARELYFWGFVVALLIFTGGAGFSIYEGIEHIRAPQMLDKPIVNFAVLAIAFAFESGSLFFALREFRRQKDPAESWWEALRTSKDPSVFVVMMEDLAALAGLVVAAIFIGLTVFTGNPLWDGTGSIVIGLILAGVAILLATECKKLLIGERASAALEQAIQSVAHQTSGVCKVNEIITVHLGPQQVVVMLSLDFDDALALSDVESATEGMEEQVRKRFPEVFRLFVRAQSRQAAHAERQVLAEAQ